MKLLVVEDNLQLVDIISKTLSHEGFHCETALTYPGAQEKINLYQYDAVMVDINLPGGSGLDLIRELKDHDPAMGIIVISARNTLDQKIEGLNLGADDYLTKPFDMAELVARIKALLRRRNFLGNDKLTLGDLTVEPGNREVTANGIKISLTRSEYDILMFFVSNPGRVLTRESIAEHIWGDNMDLADSYDFIYSHIKNLRKKILATGSKDPLKAVYGIGYKFES